MGEASLVCIQRILNSHPLSRFIVIRIREGLMGAPLIVGKIIKQFVINSLRKFPLLLKVIFWCRYLHVSDSLYCLAVGKI
jgi:hypothetical protein